jgi:hypothetical protein
MEYYNQRLQRHSVLEEIKYTGKIMQILNNGFTLKSPVIKSILFAAIIFRYL